MIIQSSVMIVDENKSVKKSIHCTDILKQQKYFRTLLIFPNRSKNDCLYYKTKAIKGPRHHVT